MQDIQNAKAAIVRSVEAMRDRNKQTFSALTDRCSLLDYTSLTYPAAMGDKTVTVWTKALSQALTEHEIVTIPARQEPYYIDDTVCIPSHRRIEADAQAVICQMPGVDVLMLRNVHVTDGTHVQTTPEGRDTDISICGGRWEESYRTRLGYGRSGKFDKEHSLFGVSTCLLFSGVEGLSLTDMTFAHTAGFAVQIGNARDIWCENIRFDTCYADGLHINGLTENILLRHIYGVVGDDLVALNMYDWLNSSINFGTMKNVLCEDLDAYPDCPYKALRIAPGLHHFDDGSTVDCRAEDIYVHGVKGILNFKMYLQTPFYIVGEAPEPAGVGSGDNIFFEDIEIDLSAPIDKMENYLRSDPVTGDMSAFTMGSNLGLVSFENIRLTTHLKQYPMSMLASVGPKSSTYIMEDGRMAEIFDPYFDSTVDRVVFHNVLINGRYAETKEECLREIVFDHIYDSPLASGRGEVRSVTVSHD